MAIEILIVDDNADIRNILNELIIDAGYKTRIAANYNQALSEIDEKMPDVAILDVKLDKGDIKEILNPYFTTKKNGTGLGLSIVNKIINDHNGELNFFSTSNGVKVEINF